MKQFILTLGLAAITAIGWGQDTNSVSYPEYREMLNTYPQTLTAPYTFFQPQTEIDAALSLKAGSMYLVKAHNNRLGSSGLIVLGALFRISEDNYNNPNSVFWSPSRVSSGKGPSYLLSSTIFAAAAVVGVNAYIQERKGLERLYLGANGITIKLN